MAQEIYMDEAVLFAQLEDTYGELPDAFAATDAILVKALTLVPLTGDRIERDLVRPTFGANPGALTRKRGTMQFTAEAAGAGVTALDAGTAPAYGKLLRMADMAEVIRAPAATIAASPPTGVSAPTGTFTYVAADPYEGVLDRLVTLECTTGGGSGVAVFTVTAPATRHLAAYSVTGLTMTDATPFALPGGATITPTVGTEFEVGDSYTIQLRAAGSFYTPVTRGQDSCHMFGQIGPNRHIFGGVKSGLTLNATADGWFDLVFDAMGLVGARSSETTPAVDFSAFQEPIVVENANTPWASLGAFEIALRSISLNAGNGVARRSLVGQDKVVISSRASTGTIVFEALDLDTVDFFENVETSVTLPVELIHGLTRGSTLHLSADRCELTDISVQEEEGVMMCSASISALPSDAGDDEFTFAVK